MNRKTFAQLAWNPPPAPGGLRFVCGHSSLTRAARPPRNSRGLLEALFLPVVPASVLIGGEAAGRVVVRLDIDPEELRADTEASYEAVRFDVDVTTDQIDDAIALRLPAPLAVYVDGGEEDLTPAEAALRLCEGGRIPRTRRRSYAHRSG